MKDVADGSGIIRRPETFSPAVSPALKALLAQMVGWIAAGALAGAGLLGPGIWPLAAVQAATAAGTAAALRSAPWWLPIHLAFVPLLVAALALEIAPGWYLAAFGALTGLYWTNFRTQVPLYLSNGATAAAVAELLPSDRPVHLLDIGSGIGSVVRPLARARPDSRFTGIEAAPLPYLLSRLLARRQANLAHLRGDFFACSWASHDVVYAFLSPVPMTAVWTKAQAELSPGSLFISNAFPVPGERPERVVHVADSPGTRLFVYRVGKSGQTEIVGSSGRYSRLGCAPRPG